MYSCPCRIILRTQAGTPTCAHFSRTAVDVYSNKFCNRVVSKAKQRLMRGALIT